MIALEKPKFRVWWVPQIGMTGKPFELDVPTIEAGLMICTALADYDVYQFENKIKPDYCSMGGLQWCHPILTEGEWWDIDTDDEDDMEDVRERIKELAEAVE